jgi:hypothetical protein
MFPEDRHHPIRLESLADEIPEEPAELRFVGEAIAAAKPFLKRRGEHRVIVERVEDRVDRVPGRGGRDAGLLDLAPNPQLAVAAYRRFRVRNRFGDPRIIDGPFGAKPVDRRVDGVSLMALPFEPLPDLRFRQLPPPEHLEPVHIGARPGLRAPGFRLPLSHSSTQ